MNSVIMIGRLARDPELRFVAGSGKAVANFSIAVDRPFSKDKQADFFRVVVWGKTAENVANYLAKGRKVAVKGYLTARSYDAANGEKKYVTEIVADNVEFLEWGDRKEGTQKPEKANESFGGGFDSDGFQAIEDDDDIPF
jgi:single-strand DNA-binding protein